MLLFSCSDIIFWFLSVPLSTLSIVIFLFPKDQIEFVVSLMFISIGAGTTGSRRISQMLSGPGSTEHTAKEQLARGTSRADCCNRPISGLYLQRRLSLVGCSTCLKVSHRLDSQRLSHHGPQPSSVFSQGVFNSPARCPGERFASLGGTGGLSTLPYGPHPQHFFKFPIARFLSCLPPSLRHISLVCKYESFLWGPLTPELGMLAYLLTVLDKGRG